MLPIATEPQVFQKNDGVWFGRTLVYPFAVDGDGQRLIDIDQLGREPDPDPLSAALHHQRVGQPLLGLDRERPGAGRRRPGLGKNHRAGRRAFQLQPPKEAIPGAERDDLEFPREERSPLAVHPVEDSVDVVGEVLVATAPVLDIGGIEALGEVAVEIGGVALEGATVEFTADEVNRQTASVRPVVGHVTVGRGHDRDQPGPEIRMGQRDVPGGVAPLGVAREKDPVCVDRERSDGRPQRCQDRRVFPGGILVAGLVRAAPGRSDHDRASPARLAPPLAVLARVASPPFDLVAGRRPGGMERDDSGVAAERIVFRRQLNEAADRFARLGHRHRQLVEPRAAWGRRVDRRPHGRCQGCECAGTEGLLPPHPAQERLAGGRRVLPEVVPQEVPEADGREGQLEVAVAGGRPLEPAVDRDRQATIGGQIGVEADPLEGGQPGQRGEGEFPLDLVDDRGRVCRHVGVEGCGSFPQAGHDPRGPLPLVAIGIPCLANLLEEFAVDIVDRKRLEQLDGEPILALPTPGQDFTEQLPGGHPAERLLLGGQFREVGKVLDDHRQGRPGIVVTLRLHQQPNHPQPLVRVVGIGLLGDHPCHHVGRNRAGRQTHVDPQRLLGLNALDPCPAGGDLRDPLDHVDPSRSRSQRDDPPAVLVERGRLENRAYPGHDLAGLRDPLRDPDPLHAGIDHRRFDVANLTFRDHRAGEFVVAHQNRLIASPAAAFLFERIDSDARQLDEAAVENPSVGQLDAVGSSGWAKQQPAGHQQPKAYCRAGGPGPSDAEKKNHIHPAQCTRCPPPA